MHDRANTSWPWSEDAVSVLSQLKSDPKWDVAPGTRFLMRHDLEAETLNLKLIAEDVLVWCRYDNEAISSAALKRIISKLSERIWAYDEVDRLIAACDWTDSEQNRWCELLLRLLHEAPDLLVVLNSLHFLCKTEAQVPADTLNVLSSHKRLAYACFDVLLNLDRSTKQSTSIWVNMFDNLGGYRKLAYLRIMGKPVPSEIARNVLGTKIQDVGEFGYPVSEKIDQYLEFLSYGQIESFLAESAPSEQVLRNLIATYAEIAECLIWDDTLESEELIGAFPVFVSLLDRLTLSSEDLYYLSCLLTELTVEAEETDPPYRAMRAQCAQQIEAVLNKEHHRERVHLILKDSRHADHVEMIEVATQAYGANAFDLYFALAQQDPERAFASSYWLHEMQNGQRRKFLDWVYAQFPLDVRDRLSPLRLSYSKHQKLALNRVLSHPSKTLVEQADRLTTLKLGLSSDDTLLAMNASWLLEDIPFSDWPTDVQQTLRRLDEQINPSWTTWNHKERRYNKAKDRLERLMSQAASNPKTYPH